MGWIFYCTEVEVVALYLALRRAAHSLSSRAVSETCRETSCDSESHVHFAGVGSEGFAYALQMLFSARKLLITFHKPIFRSPSRPRLSKISYSEMAATGIDVTIEEVGVRITGGVDAAKAEAVSKIIRIAYERASRSPSFAAVADLSPFVAFSTIRALQELSAKPYAAWMCLIPSPTPAQCPVEALKARAGLRFEHVGVEMPRELH